MLEWLRSIGVEPTNPEQLPSNLPPLPDMRKIMLDQVRWFVNSARDLSGLKRIALIGSLTTKKEFPRDIDLLVTVSDDCNLTKIAELGRKSMGHMVSQRANAEVFLANTQANYPGRTCPWRDCRPGIRQSCLALHCGTRQFLYDDLQNLRLKKNLIDNPPVLLWPEPKANQEVPNDVHKELIQPLVAESKK